MKLFFQEQNCEKSWNAKGVRSPACLSKRKKQKNKGRSYFIIRRFICDILLLNLVELNLGFLFLKGRPNFEIQTFTIFSIILHLKV